MVYPVTCCWALDSSKFWLFANTAIMNIALQIYVATCLHFSTQDSNGNAIWLGGVSLTM